MYVKKNGRVAFRSNRRQNYKRNNNFSSGKVRNKGNVSQQYQKYLKLAKEAFSSGDRIQSEYYNQFADHYSRVMIENGFFNENSFENNESNESTDNKVTEQNVSNVSNENISSSKNTSNMEAESDKPDHDDQDEDHESIESVDFISQPVKKKTIKTKKIPS